MPTPIIAEGVYTKMLEELRAIHEHLKGIDEKLGHINQNLGIKIFDVQKSVINDLASAIINLTEILKQKSNFRFYSISGIVPPLQLG